MFKRIYPKKDCFITNQVVSGFDASHSNTGASEILYLFKTATTGSDKKFAHVLIDFDTIPNVSGAQYILHLFDAEHEGSLPYGYSVFVYPNTTSFSEGAGHDLDTYQDLGTSNWLSASAGVAWPTTGAYPTSGTQYVTATFDDGHEDIDVDVTSIITSATEGFFIQIDPTLEEDDNDYYNKMFHSRQTHFVDRRPYIEVRWNDSTGTLSTGSQQWLITSGAFSGVFMDAKYSGTLSGTMTASYVANVNPTGALDVHIYNLKPVYDSSEIVTLNLSIRAHDYNLAVVTTASSAHSPVALTNSYYRITNVITDEVVVPFGTCSTSHTKMSYNDNGNFLKFEASSLSTGTVYRIEFLYNIGSDWKIISSDDFKFGIK